MASKNNLRKQRTGTVINNTSEKREGKAAMALGKVILHQCGQMVGYYPWLQKAKGNAIERLGKNVIGFRTALLNESIFPFVCFGDGCDFAQDSSILDRVITISMFGKLNISRIHNEGPNGIFNRGSFYFREKLWTPNEMSKIMADIAEKSVYYYFSKYGEESFK